MPTGDLTVAMIGSGVDGVLYELERPTLCDRLREKMESTSGDRAEPSIEEIIETFYPSF